MVYGSVGFFFFFIRKARSEQLAKNSRQTGDFTQRFFPSPSLSAPISLSLSHSYHTLRAIVYVCPSPVRYVNPFAATAGDVTGWEQA